MPSSGPNPLFLQPSDFSVKGWRYLDLAKAVSLLQTGELFFCRMDSFSDLHEGAITKPMSHSVVKMAAGLGAPDVAEVLTVARRCTRKLTYANCWHLNANESEAMWQLYCPSNQGIAIQTTYQKLAAWSLDIPNALVGMVSYIDYELAKFTMNSFLEAFMHKRQAFQHEQEARILIHQWDRMPKANPPTLEELRKCEAGLNSQPQNISFTWNLEDNVERIVVHPYAPRWYFDVVRKLVDAVHPSLSGRVQKSTLGIEPLF